MGLNSRRKDNGHSSINRVVTKHIRQMATPKKGPLAAHYVLLNRKGRKIQIAAARENVDVMTALARRDTGSNSTVLSF